MMEVNLLCLMCNVELKSIFIKCFECNQNNNQHQQQQPMYICLNCFSQGIENHTHKNTHAYSVLNLAKLNSFSNWNLRDEYRLLDAINKHKTYDWQVIADLVNTNDMGMPFATNVNKSFSNNFNKIGASSVSTTNESSLSLPRSNQASSNKSNSSSASTTSTSSSSSTSGVVAQKQSNHQNQNR
jgi:hypothetical protein